ncbi:hypothetical protein RJ639_013389 [Escallonia herrerae]|uniref:Uncharacterized protein n=1 Tax=Escallonia herrerae TaxID=1293975 RepID=A0AA88VJL1_9ASTE|nr:hypothetical protein RJ639_013389 [Escallonia herrerae]
MLYPTSQEFGFGEIWEDVGHDNKVDIPYAVSGQELHRYFGSSFLTTGKGNFNLANSNLRPVEPSCAA